MEFIREIAGGIPPSAETGLTSYKMAEKFLAFVSKFPSDNDAMLAERMAISQDFLERALVDWCGTGAEELRYFFSTSYSRSVLLACDDLFFTRAARSAAHGHTPSILPFNDEDQEKFGISYCFADTCFGTMLLAETDLGICFVSFAERREDLQKELRMSFARSPLKEGAGLWAQKAISVMEDQVGSVELSFHLRGTCFQRSVWQQLVTIAPGALSSYGSIASSVGDKKAARAVGAAVGSNPAAFFVPCHRVVNANGTYGNFRWGNARKKLMIAWEAAKYNGKGNHA